MTPQWPEMVVTHVGLELSSSLKSVNNVLMSSQYNSNGRMSQFGLIMVIKVKSLKRLTLIRPHLEGTVITIISVDAL